MYLKRWVILACWGFVSLRKNGGLALDYSITWLWLKKLDAQLAVVLPLAIGVQTDMATPALARFSSKELRDEFFNTSHCWRICCLNCSIRSACWFRMLLLLKRLLKKMAMIIMSVNGSKMWITNSLQADFFCLLANTSDDKPRQQVDDYCASKN